MPVLDPFGRAATPWAAPIDTAQVLDQFRAALIARDIIPPEPIVADGRLHLCNAFGRHGKGDAAYVLHLDGLPAGGFENHRDGRDWETWRFDLGRLPTAAERDTFAQVAQVARRMLDDDLRHRQQEVRAKAERIWAAAPLARDTHPYLARKAVCAYGLRVFKGALVWCPCATWLARCTACSSSARAA
jgi:putative DNA primase/helicase